MLLQLVSEVPSAAPVSHARLELFPTSVFAWRWPSAALHKTAILDAVLRRRTGRRGVWESSPDLPAWPEPAVRALTRWVAERAQEASSSWHEGIEPAPFGPWRTGGWATIGQPGCGEALRHHATANWHWSAVYCLEAGGSGGALIFEERGTGLGFAGAAVRRSRRVVPVEGQLLVFPAWLHHKVEPHLYGGERIWIGFNLHNAALEASRLWEPEPAGRFARLVRRLVGRRDPAARLPPGTDVLP